MFDDSFSTLDEAPERAPISGLTFGQATDQGRIRERNEDHHAAAADLGFFVIADGVGGAPEGATAARLATAAMIRSLRSGPAEAEGNDCATPASSRAPESHAPRLVAAALMAHQMIRTFADRRGCFGAATTMAALWVAGDRVHIANTGDSRVYRLTDSGLEQLTKDHTAIQDHIETFGPPSPVWARHMENVVTQVLGGRSGRVPSVELTCRMLQGRETFLLCTDGLHKLVSDADIAFVLRSSPTPQQAADILVQLANDFGGLDNITCIVVQIEPKGGPMSRSGLLNQ